MTRPDPLLRGIFSRSGLRLVRALKQQKFPKELYPVYMYALRPGKEKEEEDGPPEEGEES